MHDLAAFLLECVALGCPDAVIRETGTAIARAPAGAARSPRATWVRYAVLPASDEGGEPTHEVQVVLLGHRTLLDLRVASDGASESILPLSAVARVRLHVRDDRIQVEIHHGDCISWIETGPAVVRESGLLAFHDAFRAALEGGLGLAP
ncbi:MAG: hypothetical protein JXB39_05450 [Deltaproteobacteria bacterium]|nr:hypothetical protein [Deltaproteobacteria bacterium]